MKIKFIKKDLYIPLINFELLRDKNEYYVNILCELYKNDPYLFNRALKEDTWLISQLYLMRPLYVTLM
ncbi:protein YorC [Bacillus sp. FW1]|nr:protein YorC [Bacillus sp. FW1]